MRNLRKSVLVVLLIASLAPLNALPQDLTEARADSLVSYIELLERDLRQCEIVSHAQLDSARVDLDILRYEISIYKDARAKWYHDPRLWFLVGAACATVVIGASVQITF